MDTKSKSLLATSIILLTLILDQVIKIIVKTNFYYGESVCVTDWFYFTFVENMGMAFGMQVMPKVVQTMMRLVFSGFILWYIILLVKANFKNGYIICVSLIFAGAIGNVLDSIFYGVIFSESTYTDVATFVSVGEGYADWFYGKVVDMFYFPLLEFDWPSWMPFIGGKHFIFFSPVFNFADAAISGGTIALLIFYPKMFGESFLVFKKTVASERKDLNA
ncbi:MAG TPA: lipoprotein signal peptidase [Bacteroides mediterraneensis]|uniref:lipoprotein signal peptidase n=1 Tax=Bacteroides mediterraneensis TaxID=1841856 RepID=UPI00262B41EA|nr:lipoprotein signal peptidase [Bacteroides mediterraneensis]HJH63147.1 lipoprotein signal peptidase [Bacteroides mediterraneensis]